MRKGFIGEGAAVANIDIQSRDLSMRLALKILQEEVTAKEWWWLERWKEHGMGAFPRAKEITHS